MGFHSIVEAVCCHAASQPDALCLADAKQGLSYAEVWGRVVHAAGVLRNAGLRPGECVLAEHTQDAQFSITLLAIQLAGGIFVPLERGASADCIGEILRDTSARFVIGKHCAKHLPGDVILLDSASFSVIAETRSEALAIQSFPTGEETAEVLFSTGTTGKSKGIELTHNNVIAVAENVVYGVEMRAGNIEMIFAPLSHSHGLRRHYANLMSGNAVVLHGGVVFVQSVFELMERYSVTAIDIVPSAMKMLLKLSGDKLASYSSQLRYIQLGTAPLEESEREQLRQLLPDTRLYDFYGSTEAGCSCIIDFSRDPQRIGCIGKPTRNSDIQIVDKNRKPMVKSSAERPGYVACRGGMLMKGYWHQPELTGSVVENGYIYTSDRGYFDDDGYLYLLGRDDDVINCGGIKISPTEIERVVMQNLPVSECACVAKKDAVSGQVPVLFLVLNPGETFARDRYLAVLAEKVDAVKLPRDIHTIEQLPRTFNGKLLRSKLREILDKG